MLHCLSDYRNVGLGLHVLAGEYLTGLGPAVEDFLQVDSPGSFELVEQVPDGAVVLDAAHPIASGFMHERELAARRQSERGQAGAMSSADHGAVQR